jgi:hypothetical protein
MERQQVNHFQMNDSIKKAVKIADDKPNQLGGGKMDPVFGFTPAMHKFATNKTEGVSDSL